MAITKRLQRLAARRRSRVPPVFIVVCNNTSTSKLVYEYISGFCAQNDDGTDDSFENGRLALFRNYDEHGNRLARPNTLLIDSEQLESGEALDKDFRAMAAAEIEQFRREIIERTRDAQAGDKIDDATLLREVMNTVGKAGKLGEQIRCVVSVSMLTEGWDANTVTHILGVRAFGTQLLCEQVVGRGLRRQSYDLNDESLFNVEYADILGIPFDFTAKPVIAPLGKPRETIRVHAVRPDRDALEIPFPASKAIASSCPKNGSTPGSAPIRCWNLTPELVGPSVTENQGIIGEGVDLDPRTPQGHAPVDRAVPPHAPSAVQQISAIPGEEPKLHLFGQLKRITRQWLEGGYLRVPRRHFARAALLSRARRHGGRAHQGGDHRDRLPGERPVKAILDAYNPTGSTRFVNFTTSKDDALADRSAQMPCQLGGLRQ